MEVVDINVFTWNFFIEVADCVLKTGGVIFGGFPRDLLLRSNTKLLPQDIDIFIPKYEQLSALISILESKSISCELSSTLDKYGLACGDVIVEEYYLTKKIINMTVINVGHDESIKSHIYETAVCIRIDISYDIFGKTNPGEESKLFPPFNCTNKQSLDFICNSLYIRDTWDLRLSKYTFNNISPELNIHILDSIKSDIKNRQTHIIQRVDSSINPGCCLARFRLAVRIMKMIHKSWSIKGQREYYLLSLKKFAILSQEGTCPICLNNIANIQTNDEINCQTFVLVKCCCKPFHVSCFLSYIKSEFIGESPKLMPRCPCCRANVDVFGIDITE